VDFLDTALREGRLDASEHDRRSRAARAATSVRELDRLLADLPRMLSVREWAGHLRIRQADREQVTRWLADALAEGRLTNAEHERRLKDALLAGVYAGLTGPMDGVPGPTGTDRVDLLVSAADRQSAADRLGAFLTDGLISAKEHASLQASVERARSYRDLDPLVADRGYRASLTERAQAVRRLDRALAAGRLTTAEHARRIAAADRATRDDELADLMGDLPRGPALFLDDEYRLSDDERDLAIQELQDAVDDGRLALDEYDERTGAVYAASTIGHLRPLLTDLRGPEWQQTTRLRYAANARRKAAPVAAVRTNRLHRFFLRLQYAKVRRKAKPAPRIWTSGSARISSFS
jgi:hypothetical protein